jgi:hypothetical protein
MSSGSRWVNPGSPSTGCGASSGCGSNFGAQVALFAPGAGIQTAWWTPSGPTGQYSTAPPGTSAAAAIVSGAAAAHLQALWVPMKPGVIYLRTPSEEARLMLLANFTQGVLSDVRSSPNQLLFNESWPVSVGRVEVPGAALNAAAASPSGAGVSRLYAAAGFDRRFAENAPSGAVPFAVQLFDQSAASWAAPVALPDGACTDVHDANIAHAWIACTRVASGGRQQGFVRAILALDGSTVGQVDVGRTAAGCSGSAQPQSIARAVRSNSTTGAIYVVGEAWCGSGPRHAFLALLDTPATTVLWEQRIFGTTDLESAAYGLVVRQQPNAIVVVAGYRTAGSGSVRRARVEQFLDQGVSIGAVSIGPVYDDASAVSSAAFAVALDAASGDVLVTSQRDAPGAPFAVVQRLDPTFSVAWESTFASARIQGLAALKDGLLVAGHSDRVLPTWPHLPPPPPQLPPGMPLGESRAFLMRLNPDGGLRWTHYVEGHRVEALGLQGELELDGTSIAHVVGGRDSQPCTVVPPGCPVVGFVESFRVK